MGEKRCAIIGAGAGLGRALAARFAREGYVLTLLSRSEAGSSAALDAARAAAPDAAHRFLAADAQEPPTIEQALTDAGPFEVLIYNARGGYTLREPLAMTFEELEEIYRLEVIGAHAAARAVMPAMIARGGGVIVNISSGAATSSLEGWSHYCASKAAALMLTQCGAKELGPKGVRVVGLSPGTVATDMQVAIKASGVNPVSKLDPSVHIPTEWVARAALLLCGDQGAEYEGRDFRLRDPQSRRLLGLPEDG